MMFCPRIKHTTNLTKISDMSMSLNLHGNSNCYRRQDVIGPRLEHYGAHDSRANRNFQNFGFRPQEFKKEFSAQPQIPWVGPVSYNISLLSSYDTYQ